MVSLGNPDSSFIIITDSRAVAAMSGKLQFVADANAPHVEAADKLKFVGHSVEAPTN
jgi:hypothetical protein